MYSFPFRYRRQRDNTSRPHHLTRFMVYPLPEQAAEGYGVVLKMDLVIGFFVASTLDKSTGRHDATGLPIRFISQ